MTLQKDRQMRSLITITLLALISSTSFALSPAIAVDASISAKCNPDAPEGYKRPGGYCDQIDSKGSLMDHKTGCDYQMVEALLTSLAPGERLLVADDCLPAD